MGEQQARRSERENRRKGQESARQETRRRKSGSQERKRQEALRRKKRARRRRRRIRRIVTALFVILLCFCGYMGGRFFLEEYQSLSGLSWLESIWAGKQAESYPEPLKTALENNPELEAFARGYEKAMESGAREDTTECALTGDELKEEHPLFLQWDERWGYRAYGESVIGLSGCGPTCMSMTAFYLTRDESITPDRAARYAQEAGYYVEGSGTAWSFMTEGAGHFGLNAEELSLDEQIMKRRLDGGSVIICAMGPGDFTSRGHFIVIYGYDDDGFLVSDPNSVIRSEKSWDYDTLHYQIRNLWAYTV